MLRHLLFKLLCLFSILLLSCFSEGDIAAFVNQSPDCGGGKCSYLPLVTNPVPVLSVRAIWRTETKFIALHIDGEVKNVIELPISNIVLRTKIYRNNVFAKELQHSPLLRATLPGQINLYTLDAQMLIPLNSTITSVTELVTATVDSSILYRNLTVERITTGLLSNLGGNTVTVTLKNNHAKAIHDVQIDVWALELNQDYVCTFTNCYSQRFIAALLPGQTYTATMDWNVGNRNVTVPANVISVVAQGVISP